MKAETKRGTPRQVARLVLSIFREKADPARAEQAKKYFKETETIKTYGLPAKAIDDMIKDFYKKLTPIWDVDDAIGLCDILLPNPYLEAKGFSSVLLHKFKRDFPKKLFFKIEEWLCSDYCNNWAAVDVLCQDAMYSLLLKYPELEEKIIEWPFSVNRWVRRAAAVSFIKIAREGKMLDTVYKISVSLFEDDDDLVQKANGWLLREAGKSDLRRLENFLLKQGSVIPRTTLRYAIERFDERKRKMILIKTRPEKERSRHKKN